MVTISWYVMFWPTWTVVGLAVLLSERSAARVTVVVALALLFDGSLSVMPLATVAVFTSESGAVARIRTVTVTVTV